MHSSVTELMWSSLLVSVICSLSQCWCPQPPGRNIWIATGPSPLFFRSYFASYLVFTCLCWTQPPIHCPQAGLANLGRHLHLHLIHLAILSSTQLLFSCFPKTKATHWPPLCWAPVSSFALLPEIRGHVTILHLHGVFYPLLGFILSHSTSRGLVSHGCRLEY